MMLDTVIGNAQTLRDLQGALKNGCLLHSILLCGEPGTGAGYVARCLAADYLYPENTGGTPQSGGAPSPANAGASQVMANESPEYLCMEGEGVSGDIRIDAVREVRRQVFHTALSARGRVVHVAGAEHLNASSANALLKVLEEPPEGVLFLLTAPGDAAVLPTLRSRCACYTLAPVSQEQCVQYLLHRFSAVPDIARRAPEYAALFGGKIGSCVNCLTDAGMRARLDSAKQLADAVQAQDTYLALHTMAGYEKDRAQARGFLALLREVCAAALRGAYPVPDADKAARAINAVRTADTQLAGNGSTKLVLTCLAARLTAGA
ncbi:MAG: hypothetical protein RR951_01105 [Ruthenibacterium sp.]